jgi:hypothetical protein
VRFFIRGKTMLKSWVNDEKKSEFPAIREKAHMAAAWEVLQASFPRYFESFVAPKAASGDDLLEKLKSNERFRVKASKAPKVPPPPDFSLFEEAVENYEAEAQHYRAFFDSEVLEEFREDDPDSFKTELSKKCPVIRYTLNSRLEDLKEWKYKYHATHSKKMLETFGHLLALGEEYESDRGKESKFDKYDSPAAFEMEDFNEEVTGVPGVIGGGIKTAVLHHMNARIFANRSSRALFGLYFMTAKQTFKLRSKTSEFLMIDDKLNGRDLNIREDHNYWYPYELFAFYALRLFRLLRGASRERGYELDSTFRFVYVQTFLDHVCDENGEDMKVLKGVDELTYAHG